MTKSLITLFLVCVALRADAQNISNLLPPPKTAYNHTDISRFYLTPDALLAVPDSMSPDLQRAVERLEAEVLRRVGQSLRRCSLEYYLMSMPPHSRAIVVVPDTSFWIKQFASTLFGHGESAPTKGGGYVVDIRELELILYVDTKADGAMNAVATTLQLLRESDASFPACHIWDQPDYQNRWVFSQHNMLVNSNLKVLHDMADTMATYKLNGIQQNDFKLGILDRMSNTYFNNVDSLKKLWKARSIEVIPGVCGIGWSSTLLVHDPNLAEGVQARTRYVIEADTGRLIADANAILPNGDFEQVDGQGRLTGYTYYDTCFHQDRTVFHSGQASAKASAMPAGSNARCTRSLKLQPHQYYSLSVWMKTSNCNADEFRLLVLADTGVSQYRAITFTALNVNPTNDWTKVEVFFNTLEYSSVIVYAGLWGANGGTLWLDDFRITPAGLCNVIRRSGAPLSVRSLNGAVVYTEGTDFRTIRDTWWDTKNEEIGPFHTPPTFRRNAGSALQNGDTVEISYYHPFASVSDNQGNGSVMVCVSEDSLYRVLDGQISGVNKLFSPRSFFMGHDEIRNMNRDEACRSRGLSPALLLADNMRRCDSLILHHSAQAQRFMWSDMLDSLHNAVNNYYLIDGDLRGVWDKAPKNICMMNWNSGNMNKSLDFFARHGYTQMTAPFFTNGNFSSARTWRLAQDDVEGLKGMMYVTWTNEYRYLPLFAYYAWGAGAYVIHPPLDSTCFDSSSAKVVATITADPYYSSDIVTGAELVVLQSNNSTSPRIYPMIKSGTSTWVATLSLDSLKWFRYTIKARDSEGFLREIPSYLVKKPGADTLTGIRDDEGFFNIQTSPLPAAEYLNLSFGSASNSSWIVELFDLQGRCVMTSSGLQTRAAPVDLRLDMRALASGSYVLRVRSVDPEKAGMRQIQRVVIHGQ